MARKLEMYRKRAKRAAEQKLGKADANVAMATWHRFVSWSRYNLLYSPASQKALLSQGFSYSIKKLWAAKRSALADMIRQTLEQRCYAALSEPQLKRVVRLIKEELRRKRHPFRLRELLNADSETERDFLFEVVSRKIELIPLAGADLPEFVRALERAEKFRDKTYRANPSITPELAQDLPAIRFGVSQSVVPPGISEALPELSDSGLAYVVARWFEDEVDQADWQLVGDLAVNETLYNPPFSIRHPSTRILHELIAQTRPALPYLNLTRRSDLITHLATWVLTWLYAYRPYPQQVVFLVDQGCRRIVRRDQLPTAA